MAEKNTYTMGDCLNYLRAEIKRQAERIAELEEVLEPFAVFACELDPGETCGCNNCVALAALAPKDGES